MTTNHPEKLDEALIRPGHVDHQVAFENATQVQIKELFERMYTNDLPGTKLDISSSTTSVTAASSTSTKDVLIPPPTPVKSSSAPSGSANGTVIPNGTAKVGEKEELTAEELSVIAKAFAKEVPDDMLSPAEIQGFLLKRKKDPRKALLDVGGWVEGMVEVKRTGTKLVNVQ
jgi:chaperone BCS1